MPLALGGQDRAHCLEQVPALRRASCYRADDVAGILDAFEAARAHRAFTDSPRRRPQLRGRCPQHERHRPRRHVPCGGSSPGTPHTGHPARRARRDLAGRRRACCSGRLVAARRALHGERHRWRLRGHERQRQELVEGRPLRRIPSSRWTSYWPPAKRALITPGGDAPLFRAFVGSLGLLGIITSITLQLQRISSGHRDRAADVPRPAWIEVLAAFADEEPTSDFMEAWLDGFASGDQLGRGILTAATYDGSAARRRTRIRRPGMLGPDGAARHRPDDIRGPIQADGRRADRRIDSTTGGAGETIAWACSNTASGPRSP